MNAKPLNRRRALQLIAALSGTPLMSERDALAFPFQDKPRAALLVGVGSYPVFGGDKDKEHPGAVSDAGYLYRLLTKTLDFAPNQVQMLVNADATSAAVETKLNDLLAFCKKNPGAVVYFHFSGRGSVSDPRNTVTPLLPTLCPYDAALDSAAKDIPLDRIAAWTREVLRRNCYPVVSVDTCWFQLAGRDIGLTYVHNPLPRVLIRSGGDEHPLGVKPAFWSGSGVFFAAANAVGSAYEYMVDPQRRLYYGMMTHQIATTIHRYAREKGTPPTPAEVIESINGWISQRRATYTGVRFYPAPGEVAEMTPAYTKPLFDVAALSPLALAEAKTLGEEIAVKTEPPIEPGSPTRPGSPVASDQLRVTVTIRFPEDRKLGKAEEQELEKTMPSIQKAAQQGMGEYGRMLDPYEAETDRTVLVHAPNQGGKWRVEIVGSEREVKARPVGIATGGLEGVLSFLKGEAGTYLKTQALVARLASIARKCSGEGVSLELRKGVNGRYVPVAESDAFQTDDRLKLAATLPADGYGLLVDSYSADRIYQLVWPHADYITKLNSLPEGSEERRKQAALWSSDVPPVHDNLLTKGMRLLPSNSVFYKISPNQPPGPARYRLLFAPKETASEVPALTPESGPLWTDNRAWESALAAHLEALLSLLETRPEAFRVVEARYTVRGKGRRG